MPHIPSKEKMVEAVRKSKCTNLDHLPLETMSAEVIYTHLREAECPCLKALLNHHEPKPRPRKSTTGGQTQED